MTNFNPKTMKAGKKYKCRDGSTVTLRVSGEYLKGVENNFYYSADTERGHMVYEQLIRNDKDIVSEA